MRAGYHLCSTQRPLQIACQRQLSSAARHNKPSKRSQTDKTSQNRKTQRTKPSQQDTSNTNNPSKQSQTNKTPQIQTNPANKSKPTGYLTGRTPHQRLTKTTPHLNNSPPRQQPTSQHAQKFNPNYHRHRLPQDWDTYCRGECATDWDRLVTDCWHRLPP